MAWGYSPRQVIKRRSADLTPDKSRGLGILLGFAAVLAAVLMFAVISEIMSAGDTEDNGEAPAEAVKTVPGTAPTLVGGDIEWKTGGKETGKTYSEYKRRSGKKEDDNLSSWERFQAEEKARQEALQGKELTERERESREGID